MATLYLIRHGLALKGWGDDLDPPLADEGKEQAAHIAEKIGATYPKMKIISSPMQRCQQTAASLAALWEASPQIVSAVSEIPSPDGARLEDRALWLRSIMQKKWQDLDEEARLTSWKKNILEWAHTAPQNCVVFSHFVAINTMIGAALGDDRFMSHRPDYCSLWAFANDGARLSLVETGGEMETKIL